MSETLFGVDVQPSAEMAVALVNTSPARGGVEGLVDTDALVRIGRESIVYYVPAGTKAELHAMRTLRDRLDEIISEPDQPRRFAMINELFLSAAAIPQIVTHTEDARPHFHYTLEDAPYVDHIKGTSAYALARLVIMGAWDRLRTCEGVECERLFLDTTRNGKRRYCDSRTCGNRAHAARYRRRVAAAEAEAAAASAAR